MKIEWSKLLSVCAVIAAIPIAVVLSQTMFRIVKENQPTNSQGMMVVTCEDCLALTTLASCGQCGSSNRFFKGPVRGSGYTKSSLAVVGEWTFTISDRNKAMLAIKNHRNHNPDGIGCAVCFERGNGYMWTDAFHTCGHEFSLPNFCEIRDPQKTFADEVATKGVPRVEVERMLREFGFVIPEQGRMFNVDTRGAWVRRRLMVCDNKTTGTRINYVVEMTVSTSRFMPPYHLCASHDSSSEEALISLASRISPQLSEAMKQTRRTYQTTRRSSTIPWQQFSVTTNDKGIVLETVLAPGRSSEETHP